MHSVKTLPIIYLVLVLLFFFNIFGSVIVYGAAALAIAFIFIITREKEKEINLSKKFLFLGIFLILLPKILLYTKNPIPRGYDAGIYKYAIENSLSSDWTLATFPPVFNFIMKSLNFFFSSDFILTYILIFFSLLLGYCLYITTKIYFNKNTAILATLLYSLSIVQFKAFTLLYYKNIIAMSFLLLSFYFLKKQKHLFFILSSIILAGIHRPTFLLFALSFFLHTFFNRKKNFKLNLTSGTAIILATLLLYINKLSLALKPGILDVATLSIGGGTFLDLLEYRTLILLYIPFLAIGIYTISKNKNFNILFIWFAVNFIIVIFQLFFFNRYIIMLDLITVVIVAIGLLEVVKDNRTIGVLATLIIFFFLSFNVFSEALNSSPLISNEELDEIKLLATTEPDAFVMATHKNYSPWLLGYSNRKTIAPGLFEYDYWGLEGWNKFWAAKTYEEIEPMLQNYSRPLYIHAGNTGRFNMNKFNDKCFEPFIENKVWKVVC